MIDGIITDKVLDWKSLDIKPGGYLLIISNNHKIICDVEDAGFEIKDMILYLPDIQITVARQPLIEKTIIKNIIKHGTGCINIDNCRIKGTYNNDGSKIRKSDALPENVNNCWIKKKGQKSRTDPHKKGRFPANVIHSGNKIKKEIDKQSGLLRE